MEGGATKDREDDASSEGSAGISLTATTASTDGSLTQQFFNHVMYRPPEQSQSVPKAYRAKRQTSAGNPLLAGEHREVSTDSSLVTVQIKSPLNIITTVTRPKPKAKTYSCSQISIASLGVLGVLVLAACLYLIFGNKTMQDKLGEEGKIWLLSGTAGFELLNALTMVLIHCRSRAKVYPDEHRSPGF